MRNIKLTIAYDGTHYCGWQIQTSSKPHPDGHRPVIGQKLRTIQEEVESALQKIFKKKIRVEGSGRTDAGAHAVAQVAHFKLDGPFDLEKLAKAVNAHLPQDIFILSAQEAARAFHARFSARRKTYRYLIINCPERPLFVRQLSAWVRHPLDLVGMRSAAKYLVGRHDFRSFQASDRIERRSVTTIYKIGIKKTRQKSAIPFVNGLNLVVVDIEARGFLRNMVRNIVGTLIEAGRGRMAPQDVKNILKKKDRRSAGPCVPAAGLYLMNVCYGRS